MKIKSFVSDFVLLGLTDRINYKHKGKFSKIKTLITEFFIFIISFILAEFITQTKNDMITIVIAFLIIFFIDAITKTVRLMLRTSK